LNSFAINQRQIFQTGKDGRSRGRRMRRKRKRRRRRRRKKILKQNRK